MMMEMLQGIFIQPRIQVTDSLSHIQLVLGGGGGGGGKFIYLNDCMIQG